MNYNQESHSYDNGYSMNNMDGDYSIDNDSMNDVSRNNQSSQALIPYKFYSSHTLYSKDGNNNDFLIDRMQKIRNLREVVAVFALLNRDFRLYFRNMEGAWQWITNDAVTVDSILHMADPNDILTFHAGNMIQIQKEGSDTYEFYVSVTEDITSLCSKYTQKTGYALNPDRLRIKTMDTQMLHGTDTMSSLGEPLQFSVLPTTFSVTVRYNGFDTPISVQDDTTLRQLHDMCRDRFSLNDFHIEILNGARLEYTRDTLDMYRVNAQTTLVITIPVVDKRRVKYLCESCGRYVSFFSFGLFIC